MVQKRYTLRILYHRATRKSSLMIPFYFWENQSSWPWTHHCHLHQCLNVIVGLQTMGRNLSGYSGMVFFLRVTLCWTADCFSDFDLRLTWSEHSACERHFLCLLIIKSLSFIRQGLCLVWPARSCSCVGIDKDVHLNSIWKRMDHLFGVVIIRGQAPKVHR